MTRIVRTGLAAAIARNRRRYRAKRLAIAMRLRYWDYLDNGQHAKYGRIMAKLEAIIRTGIKESGTC